MHSPLAAKYTQRMDTHVPYRMLHDTMEKLIEQADLNEAIVDSVKGIQRSLSGSSSVSGLDDGTMGSLNSLVDLRPDLPPN